jgi:hypothetical protein
MNLEVPAGDRRTLASPNPPVVGSKRTACRAGTASCSQESTSDLLR